MNAGELLRGWSSRMKVIVGLGNPGKAYDLTPHNIGFELLDELAAEDGVKFRRSWRFPLESASIRVRGEEVMLVKPLTFMNRSGDAVAPLLRKKGVGTDRLLVAVDDVALPLGALRLRGGGSAGSHNGLKSLIERLGGQDFPRLRLGVGPVPEGQDRVAFVLGRFPAALHDAVSDLRRKAASAALSWVSEGLEKTMNRFNG
jgi:PTH1 family peptidyl-tRNA hydrolase